MTKDEIKKAIRAKAQHSNQKLIAVGKATEICIQQINAALDEAAGALLKEEITGVSYEDQIRALKLKP